MHRQQTWLAWFFLCHLMNFLDAVMTLFAVSRGVEEANPVMAMALEIGPMVFVVVKFTLFAIGLEFIARHKRILLAPVCVIYMSVLAWHMNFWFNH